MTEDERIRRKINLLFDFLQEAYADPSVLDQIPDGATIDFEAPGYERRPPFDGREIVVLKMEQTFRRVA
jgi:hypothetical protein